MTRALGRHSAVPGVGGGALWVGRATRALARFLEASPPASLSETSQQRRPVGSFWRGGFRGRVSSQLLLTRGLIFPGGSVSSDQHVSTY